MTGPHVAGRARTVWGDAGVDIGCVVYTVFELVSVHVWFLLRTCASTAAKRVHHVCSRARGAQHDNLSVCTAMAFVWSPSCRPSTYAYALQLVVMIMTMLSLYIATRTLAWHYQCGVACHVQRLCDGPLQGSFATQPRESGCMRRLSAMARLAPLSRSCPSAALDRELAYVTTAALCRRGSHHTCVGRHRDFVAVRGDVAMALPTPWPTPAPRAAVVLRRRHNECTVRRSCHASGVAGSAARHHHVVAVHLQVSTRLACCHRSRCGRGDRTHGRRQRDVHGCRRCSQRRSTNGHRCLTHRRRRSPLRVRCTSERGHHLVRHQRCRTQRACVPGPTARRQASRLAMRSTISTRTST